MGIAAHKFSTLRDKITKLLANMCGLNKKNIAASDVVEEYGELEQSLDVIIQEVDEKKEVETEAKVKVQRKEQTMVDSGYSFGTIAMKQSDRGADDKASASKQKSRKISKNILDLTGDR